MELQKRSVIAREKRGDSLLHLAARAGRLEEVKQIIHNSDHTGVNDLLSERNQEGETPLYVAAETGHTSVVTEFLQHSDVETSCIAAKNGYNPFHAAARQGHLSVLQEMLGFFPIMAFTANFFNSTALHTAAAYWHTEVAHLLLETEPGLALIARNNGKTVLHTAARMGQLDLVKSLLAKHPNLNFRTDRKGHTALHKAVKGADNVKVVEELIMSDPLVLVLEDIKGNTALHIATRKARYQIVERLITIKGSNMNAVNAAGETPLDIAIKFGILEIQDVLKRAGAGRFGDYEKPPSITKHQYHLQAVKKVAEETARLHMDGLNNVLDSTTVVAVFISTVAFAAIFTVPGQYIETESRGFSLGEAKVGNNPAFIVFFLFNSMALFMSMAVVVVQTSILAIKIEGMEQLVFMLNKFISLACIFISISFISLAYIVVGSHEQWLAVFVTLLGGVIMVGTTSSLCYFSIRNRLENPRQWRQEGPADFMFL